MPSAAYTAAAVAYSKNPQWLVEIDLDRCGNTYTDATGGSTCTASNAGDGARCFYSFPTCQDQANFVKTTRTYRFCLNDAPWPDAATAVYPLLKKFVQTPHKVSTASFFSYPDTITLTMLRDSAPVAIDNDKTAKADAFNTASSGEFFRNLFSRNRNYSGRAVRIFRGFNASGFVLADFEQVGPEYTLADVDFSAGECKITVESPLAKLRQRKIPFPISDDNVTTATMTDVATTLSVTDGGEFPVPGDYTRNTVYVEITDPDDGNEIVSVTSISSNDLTVVRGRFGTTAVQHISTGLDVKHVACFGTTAGGAVNSVDTLQDLMEWAGVASGDVDTTKFDNMRDINWPGNDVLRIVRKSKTVARLMHEIREVRGILVYLDAAAKWAADLIGPRIASASYDDDSMRNVTVTESDKDRRTRIALWYDPSKEDARDPEDFSKAVVVVDANLETANNYGDVRERQILDLWLNPAHPAAKVRNLARRLIARSGHGIRMLEFELEIKDGTRYVGDAVTLKTRELTDFYGNQVSVPAVIVSRKEAGRGAIRYTAVDTNFSGRFFIWGPDTMTDAYDSATDADKGFGYWGDADNRVGSALVEGYKLP